jgi:hypothetical protein
MKNIGMGGRTMKSKSLKPTPPATSSLRVPECQVPDCSARVNLTIHGFPALWLRTWRSKGYITSWKQGIIRALEALQKEFVDQELRAAQLEKIKKDAPDDG